MEFDKIAEKVEPGSRVVNTEILTGGVSAEVTALTLLLRDSSAKKIVVRRYGQADLAHNPHIAQTEYELLKAVSKAGLAAPKPYTYDESGIILPSPYLVVSFVEGSTVDDPDSVPDYAKQLARTLASIHKADYEGTDFGFLPTDKAAVEMRLADQPSSLDEALHEQEIRQALLTHNVPTSQNSATLLHGDFWPGNTLWQDGRLRYVIDWEDACYGDPLADLANARLEMLLNAGETAMQDFHNEYVANMPNLNLTNLSYWELAAALRPVGKWTGWGLSESEMASFKARHNQFVEQALHKLSEK